MQADEQLTDQVSRLTNEVEVLRESVDELKTALEWALRNARITVQFDEAANAPPDRVAEPETDPTIELFEIGDGVNFQSDGVDHFGEIIALNDGENIAKVQLIRSGETVDINQDHLTRLENDPLNYRISKTVRETSPAEEVKPPVPKRGRQLTLDFESQTTCEMTEPFAAAENADESVLSKEAFKFRTRKIWNAVNGWLIDYTPAIGFDAFALGVFEKVELETSGTFADTYQVRLLKDDYALACGMAIAAEDAALAMEEQGLDDDAETVIRVYHLVIALAATGFDLEHYLPGFPVHSIEIS